MPKLTPLLNQANYLPKKDLNLIKRVFEFARRAHKKQKRRSGEPFFSHPYAVALQLAKMHFDAQMISAALLHDTLEDTSVTRKQISKKFGKEIAALVDGVTKLSRIRLKKTWFGLGPIKKEKLPELKRQIETLKKMFLAMSKDIRVVVIKIIDRLHNMRTIKYLEPAKQLRFAKETLEIFAPLAYRLGMGEIKGELEDLAFPIVYPAEAAKLSKKIKSEKIKRQKIINKAIRTLHRHLAKHKIKTLSIHGRAKHAYSLYKKLLRYNNNLSKIYDLVAIRVIVSRQGGIDACYQVLGIIHERWRPLPGRIKDYIALPKPNGYSSLHTTVFGPAGNILEIQIRTPLMHEQSEYGVAAHWQYKEENYAKKYLKKIFPNSQKGAKWLKDLINIQKSIQDPRELANLLKLDFFSDRIFVFTPEGDVKNLPSGASPIDFAYSIHTEVGYHYAGAKVNGKIVSADYQLKNGQIVEILTDKKASPKQDWLAKIKTSNARYKIRKAIVRSLDD